MGSGSMWRPPVKAKRSPLVRWLVSWGPAIEETDVVGVHHVVLILDLALIRLQEQGTHCMRLGKVLE